MSSQCCTRFRQKKKMSEPSKAAPRTVPRTMPTVLPVLLELLPSPPLWLPFSCGDPDAEADTETDPNIPDVCPFGRVV